MADIEKVVNSEFMLDMANDFEIHTLLGTMFGLPSAAVGAILTTFVFGMTGWPLVFLIVFTFFIPFIIMFSGYASELHGIDNKRHAFPSDRDWDNTRSYDSMPGSQTLMQQYLQLNISDKELFPSDIVDVLKKDLNTKDRIKINFEVYSTLKELENRDSKMLELERSGAPVSDIVGELTASRERVRMETSTILEHME